MMYEHVRGQEELFLDERQIQTWLNRVYSRNEGRKGISLAARG